MPKGTPSQKRPWHPFAALVANDRGLVPTENLSEPALCQAELPVFRDHPLREACRPRATQNSAQYATVATTIPHTPNATQTHRARRSC